MRFLKEKILDRANVLGLCWLSEDQLWLLKAALLSGEQSLDAWAQWKSQVDIEILSPGSASLLAQLYKNLLPYDVTDPTIARLKGVYRRNWCANQVQLRCLQATIAQLHASNIQAIVLSDVASLLQFYPDIGCRTLYGLELLIRADDADKVIQLLSTSADCAQLNDDRHPTKNSLFPIRLQANARTKLTFLKDIFLATPQVETTNRLWSTVRTVNFNGTAMNVLSMTDQLLHLCARAFHRSRIEQMALIADAALLLTSFTDNTTQPSQVEPAIDWYRLVMQAQRYQLILPLRNMLTILQKHLKVSFPIWVIGALHETPISTRDLHQHKLLPHNKRLILRSLVMRR